MVVEVFGSMKDFGMERVVVVVCLYFTLLLVTNMQALGELLEKKQP